MIKWYCRLLLFIPFSAGAQYPSPGQLYPGLFEQVETAKVFTDSKTFVDAMPKKLPAVIEQLYLQQKQQAGFNLKTFVSQNFTVYIADNKGFKSDVSKGVRMHIDTLWRVLSRKADKGAQSSLIPLPHPYIIPGGRFMEVYYWDSYFTMLGLDEAKKTEMMANIISNFAYLIDQFGFIPNGNRTYYLTRSQPPFFCLMVELLAHDKGDGIITRYLPQMLAEYNFWMKGAANLKPGTAANNSVKLNDGIILNRYWDSSDKPREESYAEDVISAQAAKQPKSDFYRNVRAAAESGWDFSSRWFADGQHLGRIKTTHIIPVDLNAILYHLELVIAHGYQLKGNQAMYHQFIAKAQIRRQAILKYCWNEKQGWFMDYNWQKQNQTGIESLAGVVPLFFGIATQQQAVKEAAIIQSQFLKPGGLVTTLNKTGQQWDWPNAWAPLQYMAIEGLENYRQHQLAQTIAKRWIALNTAVFNNTGKLMEKYNVTQADIKAGGGEYPLQDGFGWTNGVLLKLMSRFGDKVR